MDKREEIETKYNTMSNYQTPQRIIDLLQDIPQLLQEAELNEQLIAACQKYVEKIADLENELIELRTENEGYFGKCRNCGMEFNSALLDEYNITHCPYCGARLIGEVNTGSTE